MITCPLSHNNCTIQHALVKLQNKTAVTSDIEQLRKLGWQLAVWCNNYITNTFVHRKRQTQRIIEIIKQFIAPPIHA